MFRFIMGPFTVSNNKFIFLYILLTFAKLCDAEVVKIMSQEEKLHLREEARDMFYHAYRAYMENAYPADELMPLSCKGRYRGLTPGRGDIDDSLGNFSLTLIDTLDTLVILGDFEEFENALKLIIKDVSFDNDIIVSVFETNIRVLGGLLSGHILAEYLQQKINILPWYKGELLDMAKDIGYRLLPAFNTTTGIPHSRVNLRYGIKSDRLDLAKETCTACSGSVILEMAALSRLSGDNVFEQKAHRAMDELWKMRHRSSDLMGTVLNVHSGDWVRRDSGVGAGIDSYYEYCLKAYILLGDDRYLNRFNRHYNAVMKYISQGPMLLDVHMHRPHTNSRNYMDALSAFWPGLQVLKGDIKPAVETHEMLYQVMQRHKFIPEAFTTDFQVHWGNHPLRPEFLESTYFLYAATNDPYYLEVGKHVLKSLQKYARVPCGYAAVNDVRTTKQEDRMDSFVLAETFKYLYLLFADREDIILNLDEFIFTTEGHLLPLTLGTSGNLSFAEDLDEYENARTCPNSLKLFPETVRKPLRNMVDGICPKRVGKRRLTANEFSASNLNHLKIIKDMGINIIALNDGRVQLLHTFSSARSNVDAEEGLLFMQEMVELSKVQSQQPEALPQAITFSVKLSAAMEKNTVLKAGPAHFGINLKDDEKVSGHPIIIHPFKACSDIPVTTKIKGNIAIMERGDCMFIEKARKVQKFGAIGAIIIDNTPDTSAATSPMFSMSGDGKDDIKIPSVFLFSNEANVLLKAMSKNSSLIITLSEYKENTNKRLIKSDQPSPSEEESMFQKLKVSVQEFLNKHTGLVFNDVSVGYLKATFGIDAIKITYAEEKADDYIFDYTTENSINSNWKSIRRSLGRSILNSEKHELKLTLQILKVYVEIFDNQNVISKSNSIEEQTKWLLKELNIELYKSKDDLMVPFVDNIDKMNDQLIEAQKKLELINSHFKAVLEAAKPREEKTNRDDVIITEEQLEASDKKSEKDEL